MPHKLRPALLDQWLASHFFQAQLALCKLPCEDNPGMNTLFTCAPTFHSMEDCSLDTLLFYSAWHISLWLPPNSKGI